VDLSQSLAQSITVSVSDPNPNGLITLINITASGISNFFTNPASPNVNLKNTTFTINFTPTRGDFPFFKLAMKIYL
jgi:hypothetical protein